MDNPEAALLEIKNLSVDFTQGDNVTHAVRNVSLHIDKGETLALVGESGSGKSVTAHSILRLLPRREASHPSGEIFFEGRDLLNLPYGEMNAIRGSRISMIFQEPMTSLNPLHTIEKQIGEALSVHMGMTGSRASSRILELLRLVRIPDPESRLKSYPHELSGGQRQRVMIAMALANQPDILIADEPTTALDVTVQSRILHLLADLKKQLGMSILLITHDLGVVRHFSDRVAVMHDGRIVETASTPVIFSAPQDSYTKRLLSSERSGGPVAVRQDAPEILKAENLKVWFPVKKGLFRRVSDHVKAVDGIDFSVREGHSFGIVGESGSGKSTLGLAVLRLLSSRGAIFFKGCPINGLSQKKMRPLRKNIQVVFQDPYGSLSPRMTVFQILEEGMKIHGVGDGSTRTEIIENALKDVELDPAMMNRYPHEFSGGQRQRIAIARALVLKPELLILDEPTSALDRSVQFQVVNLLKKLQEKFKLTYLFISHDLKVVKALCHDIIVMKNGRVVESGRSEDIFSNPGHEYTKSLLEAAFD